MKHELDLLFLTQAGATLPSVRFRVLPYVEAARRAGMRAEWRPFPKSLPRRLGFYASLPRARVTVLQKKLLSSWELTLLRARSRFLAYDFDDAVWTCPVGDRERPGMEKRLARDSMRLDRMLASADVVIAGNSYLAERAQRLARRVEVVPTPLDTDVYTPPAGRINSGLPVMGWMGSSGNLRYLGPVLEALRPLAGRVRLHVVSNEPFQAPEEFEYRFEFWSGEREVEQLRAMDIGLMPLTDDPYTRGKCGFKILQYMACGVAPVASAVGFNREILRHGESGFLAESPKDWPRFVGLLADDAALRARMAERARIEVVAQFSLSSATARLFALLGLSRVRGASA